MKILAHLSKTRRGEGDGAVGAAAGGVDRIKPLQGAVQIDPHLWPHRKGADTARRVADAAPSMSRPSLSRRLAGKRMSRPVPSVSLSRRDLRFFNAFPRLRINRYEGVIRATDLRDRARELFRR